MAIQQTVLAVRDDTGLTDPLLKRFRTEVTDTLRFVLGDSGSGDQVEIRVTISVETVE